MLSVNTPAGAKTPASVTEQGGSRPTTGTCHMTVPDDAADNVIEREHPASDVEFAAVAVLATLAFETDTKGSALPPLWPMLLHFFSDFAPRPALLPNLLTRVPFPSSSVLCAHHSFVISTAVLSV
jgi:hypothetical protein